MRSKRKQLLLNLLFGFLAVAGQVGQNVSLPLWIDAGRPGNCNDTDANDTLSDYEENFIELDYNNELTMPNCTKARTIDSYFVYTFACCNFVIIFGLMLPIIKLISPSSLGQTERRFPQFSLFLIGLFDALNGVLVVFASSGKRTLPALQPILSNFMIPLTVLCRLILLRKSPTRIKAMCAVAVFAALIVSLVPTFIPSFGGSISGGADGIWKFLWPVIFMLGFVPAALMNVLQEKWLKHRVENINNNSADNRLNLIFFLFCTSCYQLLTALLLFWVDIVPGYGNANSLQQLADSWAFGISCFFGGDGCSASTGIRGTMFIGMYSVSYIGGGLLLRYGEGATLLAVVSALVTPLGFVFWTFFNESPFYFRFETGPTTWFSLGSLALMVPAIVAYNWRPEVNDDEARPLVIQAEAGDRYGTEWS